MQIDDLTAEQRQKLETAKTPEEVLALAKEEGYELNEEEMAQISGGGWGGSLPTCPKCGSADVSLEQLEPHMGMLSHVCNNCNYTW